MGTQLITQEIIKTTHKKLWDAAREEYGNSFKVPHESIFKINETIRALNVLLIWQREGSSGSPVKFLNTYSVHSEIMIEVTRDFCAINIESAEDIILKTEKRSNKYDAFNEWAKSHIFEQYTTEQLVEQSGFSYPTILKYIQESPSFRKIKKGLWEIRDAKADRDAEK